MNSALRTCNIDSSQCLKLEDCITFRVCVTLMSKYTFEFCLANTADILYANLFTKNTVYVEFFKISLMYMCSFTSGKRETLVQGRQYLVCRLVS